MTTQGIHAAWPHRYEGTILPGLPAMGPEPMQFRAVQRGLGSEGLVVEITTDARRWIGNFQRGDGRYNAVYGTPSPAHVCVIAGGTGYYVSTINPNEFEIVAAYPIQDAREIVGLDLLVFADYTNLVAYGPKGLCWRTKQVSWDGVKIDRADEQAIVGRAWDATKQGEVGFLVDARTGELEGGASPSS
jgi:hypothetical protein